MSLADTYRLAEKYANGPCPIESGVMGRLADRECEHGNLPGEEPCGCWPTPPNPLKRRRLMLGFTRARLAADAKVNPDTLRRLEAGERPIRITAEKLAFALVCDAQWLFPDEPRVTKADFSAPTRWPEKKRLAFELKAGGVSPVEIARHLEVSYSTVSRWMRGYR
jgi:transcriptional regulator with XRE-family HTH domain